MEKKFKIRICSDLDYEEIVADICYEDYWVATISQEKGINNLEIEISSLSGEKQWSFYLDEFINALIEAKKKIMKHCKE
jgi:hypothetical protein